MKKATIYMLIFGLLLAFTGCKPATPPSDTQPSSVPTESVQEETTLPSTPAIIQQKPMASVFVPFTTETTTAEDGTALFHYEYQSMSLTVQDPEIADRVIIDFLNRIDGTRSIAENMANRAAAEYTGQEDWTPHLCRLSYEPMRIDQGVLSLFGTYTTYSSGTHPNHTNVSANYDLTNGDVLTLDGILQIGASTDSLKDLVLEELAKLKDKLQLFSDYETTVTRRFTDNTSQDQAFFFTSTGLNFYFAPYEIAPYASGTITIEIPYSKLSGILYDAYFPAEIVSADSTLNIIPFEQEKSTEFTQISEAVLDKDGDMFLLYTDGAVYNLRIVASSSQSDSAQQTLFAAQSLTPGDAVMLQTNSDNIQIFYENSSGVQTATLPSK